MSRVLQSPKISLKPAWDSIEASRGLETNPLVSFNGEEHDNRGCRSASSSSELRQVCIVFPGLVQCKDDGGHDVFVKAIVENANE
jgi:hypothetical protein